MPRMGYVVFDLYPHAPNGVLMGDPISLDPYFFIHATLSRPSFKDPDNCIADEPLIAVLASNASCHFVAPAESKKPTAVLLAPVTQLSLKGSVHELDQGREQADGSENRANAPFDDFSLGLGHVGSQVVAQHLDVGSRVVTQHLDVGLCGAAQHLNVSSRVVAQHLDIGLCGKIAVNDGHQGFSLRLGLALGEPSLLELVGVCQSVEHEESIA